ncbi:hypothetical protein AX774_g7072 [Zancudomyces culisetae]|uniref:Uncharacterized protein n=1 Tax=Zancudomyces culisetae TaxID=1213189 RepID=A0A1R1PF34_ZANCU|nr:hypothetical protein AX774_g7072 [Zancudomyces culisetae]|eukprot:OMH79513.1 hypothetical protein AX774_g7072 [Zancudomyces culisetae]
MMCIKLVADNLVSERTDKKRKCLEGEKEKEKERIMLTEVGINGTAAEEVAKIGNGNGDGDDDGDGDNRVKVHEEGYLCLGYDVFTTKEPCPKSLKEELQNIELINNQN